MDLFDAIRLRRSIKPEKMKPDPVPRALLDRMLEAANWAPSHGLTEPWRFVVHTGDARFTAEPGDVWYHPEGVPHYTETLVDSVQIEVKAPACKTW